MRKKHKLPLNILLFLSTILSSQLYAQSIEQKGWVTEINSGKKSLVGTQIDFIGAVPTTSDNDGNFILNFSEKEFGQSIYMKEIYKKGFEVVNTEELRPGILNSEDKLKIVLCSKGYIDQKKAEYYDVSIETLAQEFNTRKTYLDQQLKKANADQEQLLDQLTKLKNNYKLAQINADKLAGKFAKTNFDDVSETYKRAFDQYKLGNIDYAIQILNKKDYTSSLEKLNQESEKNEKLGLSLKKREEQYIQQRDILAQNLQLKAELHLIRLEPNVADSLYHLICRLDTTNFQYHHNYSYFLTDYLKYEKASYWWSKTLELAKNTNRADQVYLITNTASNLGVAYTKLKRFDEALSILTEAEKVGAELAKLLPEFLAVAHIHIRNDILNVYAAQMLYTKALDYTTESYELYKKYEKEYPNQFKQHLTLLPANVGAIYLEVGLNDKALLALKEAYDTIDKSLSKDEERKLFLKSNISHNLGRTYRNLSLYDSAFIYMNICQEYNKKLMAINPDKYLEKTYMSEQSIANTYLAIEDYRNASIHYQECSDILDKLVEKNPTIYRDKQVLNLYSFGALYSHAKDSKSAIRVYTKAIEAIEVLAKEVSPIYELYIIYIKNNLAHMNISNKQYENGISDCKTALSIIEKNAYKEQLMFLKELYRSYRYLFILYVENNQHQMALKTCQLAMQTAKRQYSMVKNDDYNNKANEMNYFMSQLDQPGISLQEFKNNKRYIKERLPIIYTHPDEIIMHQQHIADYKNKPSTNPVLKEIALCYDSLSWYYIINKAFVKAEEMARFAMQKDESLDGARTKLALSLLMQGNKEKAQPIYREYKDKPFGDKTQQTYRKIFLKEMDELDKRLITNADMKDMQLYLQAELP
jgi:tetratricopeptide (TPR) repeat protein